MSIAGLPASQLMTGIKPAEENLHRTRRQAHLALDPRVSVNRSAVRRKLRQHRLDATRA
jgi:hypothetical protein